MRKFIVISLISFLPLLTSANEKSVTWSVTYYNAIPVKPGISSEYCKVHTPGTFIGNVNDQLKFGAKTDKGIFLDQFTFQANKKDGLHFLQGNLRARGKSWEDHIAYYCYKLSEFGLTQGVWSSGECKGFLVGKVVKSS